MTQGGSVIQEGDDMFEVGRLINYRVYKISKTIVVRKAIVDQVVQFVT